MSARRGEAIPVEVLQRAFHESGLTLSQVCFNLGWTKRTHGVIGGDTSRLTRALGLSRETSGRCNFNTNIGYDRAQRILIALDLDPRIADECLPEPEPEPAGNHDLCPECGTEATWRDSWDQERCERCWAIVRTASRVAA